MNFMDEFKNIQEQVAKDEAASNANDRILCYPTAYVGSHTIRILRSTQSPSLTRVLHRARYRQGDQVHQVLDLSKVGKVPQVPALLESIKSTYGVDLSNRYSTTVRTIFWGQVVGSTSPQFLQSFPSGTICLFMVSKMVARDINSSIANGCDAQSYQQLVSAPSGPTLQINRGQSMTDLSASLSFKQFKTADTQEAMDNILAGLGDLSTMYYHEVPTDEEVNRALELDALVAEELRAQFFSNNQGVGASNNNNNNNNQQASMNPQNWQANMNNQQASSNPQAQGNQPSNNQQASANASMSNQANNQQANNSQLPPAPQGFDPNSFNGSGMY